MDFIKIQITLPSLLANCKIFIIDFHRIYAIHFKREVSGNSEIHEKSRFHDVFSLSVFTRVWGRILFDELLFCH